MKTRKEVAQYLLGVDSIVHGPRGHRELPGIDPGKKAWHWGKCEIRALLDFIYEGPPQSPEEDAFLPLKLRNVAGKRQ